MKFKFELFPINNGKDFIIATAANLFGSFLCALVMPLGLTFSMGYWMAVVAITVGSMLTTGVMNGWSWYSNTRESKAKE